MSKKLKRKIIYFAVATVLVIVGILCIIIAFDKIYNPVTTELALNYEVEKTVTVKGLILRKESVVTTENTGEFDYLVKDGERVNDGGIIAKTYKSEEDVAAEKEIRELTQKIENLRSIEASGNVYVLGVDTIMNQVSAGLCEIADLDGRRNLGDTLSVTQNLNDAITKKQLATGGSVDFNDKINDLIAKIDELKKRINSEPKSVWANKAGYFYKNCDGYEGVTDLSKIKEMTPAQFNEIKPNEVDANAIGKIADSYSWYYVFKTDTETARGFSEGSKLYARFPLSGNEKFEIKVEKLNFENDEVLVILKSEYAMQNTVSSRDEELEIVLDTFKGLRIEDRAIRVVDGVTGVFVQMGYEVKFRTIEIIYKTDDFSIVPPSQKDGELKLYDSVIVKGDDLYDGKLLS